MDIKDIDKSKLWDYEVYISYEDLLSFVMERGLSSKSKFSFGVTQLCTAFKFSIERTIFPGTIGRLTIKLSLKDGFVIEPTIIHNRQDLTLAICICPPLTENMSVVEFIRRNRYLVITSLLLCFGAAWRINKLFYDIEKNTHNEEEDKKKYHLIMLMQKWKQKMV